MAKKGTGTKHRFGPEAVLLEFSSGVDGYLTPLEIEIIRLLERMLNEKFPFPPQPTEEVAVMGDKENTEVIPVGAGDPEFEDWREACQRIEQERAAFQMEWLIENCLEIENAEDDDGKKRYIDAFAPRRALAESLGEEFEGDDWEITLRHFIISSYEDWVDLMLASRMLQMTSVREEDVRERVKSFRR